MKRNTKGKYAEKSGFTLVELMISIGIFAFMTAFLVAKYGKFDQSLLLTNLAYDVALTIRSAQSYGISVKNAPGFYDRDFKNVYGVHFAPGNQFTLFIDHNGNSKYEDTEKVKSYEIKRNSKIQSVCSGLDSSNCLGPGIYLDITFHRPDPDAIIYLTFGPGGSVQSYAEIVLESSDGSRKKVIVRNSGQIAVSN